MQHTTLHSSTWQTITYNIHTAFMHTVWSISWPDIQRFKTRQLHYLAAVAGIHWLLPARRYEADNC